MATALLSKTEARKDDVLELTTPAPIAAVIDVGVSKTVCLAARRDPVLELHPDRPLRVLGVGQQTAPAIASGKAADFDACARAIQVAIEEAAAMAGAPISRVVASYGGPGVSSRIVRGAARVKGPLSARAISTMSSTRQCSLRRRRNSRSSTWSRCAISSTTAKASPIRSVIHAKCSRSKHASSQRRPTQSMR